VDLLYNKSQTNRSKGVWALPVTHARYRPILVHTKHKTYGLTYATNPLHTFTPKLPTCCQQVVVMEFQKQHTTADTTEFCPCQLVADLSFMLRACYTGEVANLLRTCYGETGVMEFGLYGFIRNVASHNF